MKYIDNEAEVHMVQVNENRWELRTRKGFRISDPFIGTYTAAEDYVKKYLSSWPSWKYEMVPLKKDEK